MTLRGPCTLALTPNTTNLVCKAGRIFSKLFAHTLVLEKHFIKTLYHFLLSSTGITNSFDIH